MGWFQVVKDEAPNACAGTLFGIVKSCTGFTAYTEQEVQEIQSAQELSDHALTSSPLTSGDGITFDTELIDAILANKNGALMTLLGTISGLTPEQKSLLAVISAKQVCSVALRNERLHTILANACINLLVF
tara:strand:+ start:325 stop:717 length:393 start_codon:yes stop_codon:yes gene_type:complete